jgi:hypothetical protein
MPVDTIGAVIVLIACIGFIAYMLKKTRTFNTAIELREM